MNISFCISIDLIVLSFLGFASLLYFETQHGVRGLCVLCITGPGFLKKKSFCPKNWKNGPKMDQRQGFLNLLENLVITFF